MEKSGTASHVKVERTSVSPKSSESSHKTSQGAQTATKIPLMHLNLTLHMHTLIKLFLLNIMDTQTSLGTKENLIHL